MKIEFGGLTQVNKCIGNMEHGEIFMNDGKVYLRVDPGRFADGYNAIRLKDGIPTTFKDNIRMPMLNGKLVWEYEVPVDNY